jgi:hypothetical protein
MAINWEDAVGDVYGNLHEGFMGFLGVPQAEAKADEARYGAMGEEAAARGEVEQAIIQAEATTNVAKIAGVALVGGLLVWAVAGRR